MSKTKCIGAWLLVAALCGAGCGRSSSNAPTAAARAEGTSGTDVRSAPLPTDAKVSESHCDGKGTRYEVSEYDTSGDDSPDVRKVFLRVGEGGPRAARARVPRVRPQRRRPQRRRPLLHR